MSLAVPLKQKLRVLQVVPFYRPAHRYGGPVQSVHGLARGLANLDVDVTVFTTNIDGPGNLAVPLESVSSGSLTVKTVAVLSSI